MKRNGCTACYAKNSNRENTDLVVAIRLTMLPNVFPAPSKATRGRVGTPKASAKHSSHLRGISHEVLLECDASSHRFHRPEAASATAAERSSFVGTSVRRGAIG